MQKKSRLGGLEGHWVLRVSLWRATIVIAPLKIPLKQNSIGFLVWSFIILTDVKFQALNTKIRLQCFVCVVLNYIVVGCPWPIILGFSFLRSQGNSSFGVLIVNIKLARPPITENSLNFGGRLMWKFNFEKLQLYTNLIKSVINPLFELPFQLTSTCPRPPSADY